MNFYGEDKSPERHSIHGNSPSPIRHRGNMDMALPQNMSSGSKKSNKDGHHSQGYGMGANIDGIPLGNRSPPRNSNSNNSLQGGSSNSGSPNLENLNQNYNNQSSAERFNPSGGTSDILQSN